MHRVQKAPQGCCRAHAQRHWIADHIIAGKTAGAITGSADTWRGGAPGQLQGGEHGEAAQHSSQRLVLLARPDEAQHLQTLHACQELAAALPKSHVCSASANT